MCIRPLRSRSSISDPTSLILILSLSNEEVTSQLQQVVSIAINAWGWRTTGNEGIDNHDGRRENDGIVSDLLISVATPRVGGG